MKETTVPAQPVFDLTGILADGRPKSEAERLLIRIRITMKCRFNAAVRLRRYYQFCLGTSMAFAIGLIMIPLLQNSSISLSFTAPIMHMMQVLLAVGVLVFTVIIGKGTYELRIDRLNQEGDTLKEMSRRLSRLLVGNPNPRLDDFHHEYTALTLGKEGHSRVDYLRARVEMHEEFPAWFGERMGLRVVWWLVTSYGYVIPLLLILMEVAFLTDMLNLTKLYPNVLHAVSLS